MDLGGLALSAERPTPAGILTAGNQPEKVEIPGHVGHPAAVTVMDWMLADTLGLRRRRAPIGVPLYRIFVRNLVLPFRIGIYQHEIHTSQRVRINVDLLVEPPAATDALEHVLNYEIIVDGVRRLAERGHIPLVEGLAEDILDLCFADPRVVVARIGVEKLDVYAEAESVGVVLRKRRERRRPAL
jgi:dihydroneopterin aldolase